MAHGWQTHALLFLGCGEAPRYGEAESSNVKVKKSLAALFAWYSVGGAESTDVRFLAAVNENTILLMTLLSVATEMRTRVQCTVLDER